MNKVKIGAFGAFRGIVLMQSMTAVSEAELVAVCDKNPEALRQVEKLAKAHNVEIALYTDFEDFFKHDMDAVILANYATEHTPYAVRLLRSGRHVLSEVPACETMAQAVELVEAAEESGRIFALAENYCYMDDTFEMRRRYEEGDIGEVSYGEGCYMHDQSSQHPQKTAGDPNHWRNRAYSTYYCTHALAPLLFITGRRPVRVSGFETATLGLIPHDLGYRGGGAGILMVTLDNGAVLRCIVSGFKREPWQDNSNYTVYGTKGTMETHAIYDHNISVYREGQRLCQGETENYYPERFVAPEAAQSFLDGTARLPELFTASTIKGGFHRCGDFYPGYLFVQKILGRDEGRYVLDVYDAVHTSICGILAYRSILNGGIPVEVPDLRDPVQRDKYRNDRACTTPEVAGDQLIPIKPGGDIELDPKLYAYVRSLWEQGKSAERGYDPELDG